MPKTDKDAKDTATPNLTSVFVVIFGFVFVGVSIFIFTTGGAKNIALKPETPRQAYLSILGETHTGLRLARLHDFAENYVHNTDTLRARAGRDALAAHEQQAWVHLSRTLYSLRSTDAQNSDALAAYKSTWGIWNRQQDLPTLLQASGVVFISSADTQYAPNARRSKFYAGGKGGSDAKGGTKGTGTILAGETPIGMSPYDGLSQNDGFEQITSYGFDVQNARIRFAKRPKYPSKARRKSIEAVVTLSLFIDERGNVARTELVSVDAKRYRNSFARASKRAAMVSKFHPKTVGGKPVSTSNYLRQYTFTAE